MTATESAGAATGTEAGEGTTGRRSRGALALVCLLFVLSGACGLAYEVVWSKYLGQFLGNTVLVYTSVLATFVAGLALGSLLIGRRADRFAAPLQVYGWLEVGIAAYAMLFPTLSQLGQTVVFGAAGVLPPGSAPLLAVKILMAVALLAAPTLLMGATFPVLTAHVERGDLKRFAESGANWLYFANCAGAVVGTLVTGFALIPLLGLSGTVYGVGGVNLLIGATAVLASVVSGRWSVGSSMGSQPPVRPEGETPPTTDPVLLAIALSGATAFVYELVWTRLFAIVLGSSTYSFTLMLAAFITGLALGSIAANVLPTGRRPLLWFAASEAGIGLAIACSIPFYPRLIYGFWQVKWLLNPAPQSFPLFAFLEYLGIFLVMLVPTFLFGLTFPTAIRAAVEGLGDGESIAPRAASVYGWNTVGTLIGVVAAGALLIPLLGLMRTLEVAAVGNLLIAAFLLLRNPTAKTGRQPAWGGFGVAAAVALLLIAITPRWDPALLTQTMARSSSEPPARYADMAAMLRKRQVLFYREDFGTTVAVLQSADSYYGPQRLLVVDGKTDASTEADMISQVMLAQFPLVFKPGAKDIFVLGLGSGTTAANVLSHPVENVDCVEISPAVRDAVRSFSENNARLFTDPRFHLYLDDGKTFLASTPKQYDVIISEPTNPWIRGVGSLFTKEAFESQKRKLKPGGIVAQWFHTYSLNDRLMATILKTFRSVYPQTLIFQGNRGDCVIVGSVEPLTYDFAAMERRLEVPAVKEWLGKVKVTNLYGLLAMQMHTSASAEELTADGELNTDDHPLLEYQAPKALYVDKAATRIWEKDLRAKPGSGLVIESYMAQRPPTREDLRRMIDTLTDYRASAYVPLEAACRAYLSRWPDDPKVADIHAWRLEVSGQTTEALRYATIAAKGGNAQGKERAARLAKLLTDQSESALLPAQTPRATAAR